MQPTKMILFLVPILAACNCGKPAATPTPAVKKLPAMAETQSSLKPNAEIPTPVAKQKPSPVQFEIQGLTVGSKLTKILDVEYFTRDAGDTDRVGSKVIQFGRDEATVVVYFTDGKLIGANIRFDSGDFPVVAEAFSQKFGPPHFVEYPTIKPRFGDEMRNEVIGWQTTDGMFVVSKYGSDLASGMGNLSNPAVSAFLQRQSARRAKSLKDKL